MEETEKQEKSSDYGINKDQLLTFKGKLYIPNIMSLKEMIMNEYHHSNYSRHLGYQKMLIAIMKVYFWPDMRKNIIEYLNKCLECQQVKVEHQHPTRLLQPIPILEWKWEVISLDFITGLPRSKRHNDSIDRKSVV